MLKEYINRGKVDIFITYEDYRESDVCIKYNPEIAKTYLDYLRQIESEFGVRDDITVTRLAGMPDVLTREEQTVDEDALWEILEAGIRKAAEKFVQTRQVEENI